MGVLHCYVSDGRMCNGNLTVARAKKRIDRCATDGACIPGAAT